MTCFLLPWRHRNASSRRVKTWRPCDENIAGVNIRVLSDVNLPIPAHAGFDRSKPGGSGLRHVLRNPREKRRAIRTDVANNTEDVVTDEEELRQGTETDTPDSDWIPAEEEARKLVADPAQAPASRKGRRAASHHSVGAGRNHRFVAAKSARHAAPSSGLPAWPRSATRRPTLSTPM